MHILSCMEIQKAINLFIQGKGKNKGKQPNERYSSFDYCYNYFYNFYKDDKLKQLADENNMQQSCLQLGFYLASWGMMRGSSFLLEKSLRHLQNVITTISRMNPRLWEIDMDNYNNENIELLLECRDRLIDSLGKNNAKTWDTLITKIMLGVFANIPAFDQYFKKSLKIYSFNKTALIKIKRFYEENRETFDSYKFHTFDFMTGQETSILYTKAKLIDMCGFMAGQ